MINQVGSSNLTQTFCDFKQPDNGYFIMPQTKEDEKKKKVLGSKIVTYSLLAGFGTLALMKGVMSKSFSKVLNKWTISLEKKLTKDSKLKNFYRFVLGKIDGFRSRLESINNITTLKDVGVQRLMCGKNGEHKFTRKIHEGITRLFDKISRNTVNSSYAKTHKKFANLNENIESLNERLLSENPDNTKLKDTINAIRLRMMSVNSGLEKGFGINARNKRLRQMNEASEGLFDYFWNASLSDVRNFRSKNMWSSYIAEDYLLPHKMKMANETGKLRQAITHDIYDSYNATIKAFDNIQKFVNPTDTKTNSILNELRNNLTIYKKLSGKDEVLKRQELNEKIISNLRELSYTFNISGYSQEATTAISNYVKEVESIISKSSKGELQEILTLYKQILPRNEYLKLKKQVKGAVKSLDNSIDIETNKYFDKSRDLKLGAAPTDIISILGATGAVAWCLGKSKNKDERISASLQYGIPAVGAIATSLYCTAKLVSGGKALLFGLISGWAINKVGVIADDVRKQYALNVSVHNKNND
jgi:hypothetical protein